MRRLVVFLLLLLSGRTKTPLPVPLRHFVIAVGVGGAAAGPSSNRHETKAVVVAGTAATVI